MRINGGVPQGTKSGCKLYVHMSSDLKLCLPTVKYVDDTTVIEIFDKCKIGSCKMQDATNELYIWSQSNNININVKKTKEMLITFGKTPDVENLYLEKEVIEQMFSNQVIRGFYTSRFKMAQPHRLYC